MDLPALPTGDAVIEDMAAAVQFAGQEQLIDAVESLLREGLTLKEVGENLRLKPTVMFRLGEPERLRDAMKIGQQRRKAVLSEKLETIADVATSELLALIQSPDLAPGRKIEAIALALEYCGITPKDDANRAGNPDAVSGVEIEFDERMRTIRARAASRRGS